METMGGTMETRKGYPNSIRGNGQRKTRGGSREHKTNGRGKMDARQEVPRTEQTMGMVINDNTDNLRSQSIILRALLLSCCDCLAVGYLTSAPMMVYILPSRRMRIWFSRRIFWQLDISIIRLNLVLYPQ